LKKKKVFYIQTTVFPHAHLNGMNCMTSGDNLLNMFPHYMCSFEPDRWRTARTRLRHQHEENP